MKVIGLMSGTSADGVDVALCEISGEPPQLHAQVLAAVVQPYTPEFQARILEICLPEKSSVDKLCQLNVDLAEVFADGVLNLLEQAHIKPSEVDLIGSHGQTVWHNVLPNGSVSATLQIVEGAVIAERTGITTINNFRARDVAAGGQGAPLTGYVDWLLLRHPDQWRAVQNIGGMGNVTFLPPLSDSKSLPIAFDTGPGNALMDAAVVEFSNGTLTYDRDGQMASQGQIVEDWLDELLQHPYYARGIPKTTGRELFGVQMASQLLQEGKQRGLKPEDVVHTLTMLTAATIADAYQKFAPAPIGEVIVGGGGARNSYLMQMLADLVYPTPVKTHEDIGLNSDLKEALVFAVLAYETWHGRTGNYPTLTGAQKVVPLGQVIPGDNYAALSRKTWGS